MGTMAASSRSKLYCTDVSSVRYLKSYVWPGDEIMQVEIIIKALLVWSVTVKSDHPVLTLCMIFQGIDNLNRSSLQA